MSIRYVRVDLKPVRIETRHVFVPPPHPLPMRDRPAALPAAPSKLAAFAAEMRAKGAERVRRAGQRRDAASAPSPTAADLIRARALTGRSQRDLAEEFGCSRSIIAEAERGRRRPLPVIARWTAATLAAQALRDAVRDEEVAS